MRRFISNIEKVKRELIDVLAVTTGACNLESLGSIAVDKDVHFCEMNQGGGGVRWKDRF